MTRNLTFALAITGLMAGSAAAAKPPLRDVAEIDNGVFYIAVANEIRDYCGSISARMFRALSTINQLKSRANSLGYSDDEIQAYLDSDAEKARMRAKGNAFLASRGVTYDKPETFCALGRAEIERNSAIGVLLRAN